jgi:5-methylcytosine-specific restriction endonuclease McrA
LSDADAAILDERTLVLNRSWVAVNVTTVRRALNLVCRDAARIVAPDTFESHDLRSWADLKALRGRRMIRTVRLEIPVPEVILLLTYDELPQRQVPFTRRNLYRRDGYRCQYCGLGRPTEELSIDHVLPRSRGGKSTWNNCVLACTECNRRKANRPPEEAGMILLKHPRRPKWPPTLTFHLGSRKQSWQRFVNEAYWNTELRD